MINLFSIRLSMLHAIVAAVDIDAAVALFAKQRQAILGRPGALNRSALEIIHLGPVPGPKSASGVRAAWHDRTILVGSRVS